MSSRQLPGYVRALVSVVAGVLGMLLVPVAASAAEPDPVGTACFRSQKMVQSGAVLTQHIIDLAQYHCDSNGHAAILVDEREPTEWAAPWPNQPCASLSAEFAAPGEDIEQLEAACVVSWYEYSQYVANHSGCAEEIKAAATEAALAGNLDRIDLRLYCDADDVSPEITAERQKDKFVLGGIGIGGMICLIIVVLCIVFPIVYAR